MPQTDSKSDYGEAETSRLRLDDLLLQKIPHLRLSGRLAAEKNFISGGGYGDVFEGRCTIEGRGETRVAIKRLRFYMNTDRNFTRLFEQEIYVWSKLHHNNVLTLIGYDFDDATGYPLLVSEWIANGSAWTYVNSNPKADLLRLVTGTARGLAYIHQKKIVHSDIKSDNILVSVNGDALICDFGCSRMTVASLSLADITSGLKGTSRYLATELLKGETGYTLQTDVWAFGMTVFELLARKRPYAGLTDPQAIAAIQRGDLPPFPSSWSPNLEPDVAGTLRDICQSSRQLDPSERPTMASIVDQLDMYMMRNAKTTQYSLRVARLEDLLWKTDASNFFIQMRLGDEVQKTKTNNGTKTLVWDETFTFSLSELSEDIRICIMETSETPASDCIVGYVNVKLAYLVEESACGEVLLSVFAFDRPSQSPIGILYLFFKDLDAELQVGIDIESVRLSIQSASDENFSANTVGSLVQRLGDIAKATNDGSVRIHPYINLAAQVASALYNIVSRQFKAGDKLVQVVRAMKEAFDFACDARTLAERASKLRKVVVDLLEQSIECCHLIQRHAESLNGALSVYSERMMEEHLRYFFAAKKSLDSGIAFRNTVLTSRAVDGVNDVDSQQQIQLLEKQLDPIKVDISSHPRCLLGTRRVYLDQIMDWLFSDTGQNIFWLNGVAGSGKSTISATIADHCDDRSCLAAHIFFQRRMANHGSIVRTIAYKLAEFDSSIASHVIAAVDQNKNITDALPARQFERLLLRPLNAAATSLQGPIVVILDAVDECGTAEQRREFLRLLKNEFPKLPLDIRFLITSRPEDDIVKALSLQRHILDVKLDHASEENRRDVTVYIDSAMRDVVMEPVPDDWAWDDKMKILGETANGLFVWASTAVKMVSNSDDPLEKLDELVSNSQSLNEYGLDELYGTVLRQSGISWLDARSKDRTARVLGLVLLAKESLSDVVMDNVLGLRAGKSRLTLQRLRSVVYYEAGKPVYVYHSSFADYISSPERSGSNDWFIDTSRQTHLISTRCFEIMDGMLHFNICDLTTSFLHNNDVLGLENRIKGLIPTHLEYACLHWSRHLCDTSYFTDLLGKLADFTYRNLLFWFEVLSLLKVFVRVANRALLDVSMWVEMHNTEISSFLKDASKLASTFALPIAHSTPHIYVSMLPLTKDESKVSTHYSQRLSSIVEVKQRGVKRPPMWIKTFEGHSDEVNSVAFSPNGRVIVSASEDKTVRIWDTENGEEILMPLIGHTDAVRSVSFSPDGMRIVSGSRDRTLRIWDAQDGRLILGPLEQHTLAIASVAFSPEGDMIASGSYDRSIIIWDSVNGEVVSGPLMGHGHTVHSVAFSPDGTRIASGSWDKTIRIWNVKSGKLILEPLVGHTDCISAVAFSPDGKHVASGSSDATIIIWDVESGGIVSGPFHQHAQAIMSVAYSFCGERIVSGSWDSTIRIWDARNGEVVSGPFEGHTEGILSVAFSPNRKQIVSSSRDRTIRLWNSSPGKSYSEQPLRHSNMISSVTFSADGRFVASGSDDKTIIIWNAQNGEAIARPLEGHTAAVLSLSFSSDRSRLISCSDDQTIRIWDVGRKKAILNPLKGHTAPVVCIALSPDNLQIVSGSLDETIMVWDMASGEPLLEPIHNHTDTVESIAFSPDGTRLASGSDDKTIRIWDTRSWKPVSEPLKGHTDEVHSVSFSPDGTQIVSGSFDRTVIVWDTKTGQIISGPFSGHTGYVLSAVISLDGMHVISGSADKTIRVWNIETSQLVNEPLDGHTGSIFSLSLAPDGARIASGSGDHTVRVWDISAILQPTGKQSDSVTPVTSLSGRKRFSDWVLGENGWILGGDQRHDLLLWIPPDLRGTLWRPQNTAIFSCGFSTQIDITNAALGDHWTECFTPL